MKSQILYFLLLFSSFQLRGQEVTFGIFAGTNLSRWPSDDALFANSMANVLNQEPGLSDFSLESKPRIGIAAGGYIDIPLIKSFSIVPTFSYMQKGVKLSGSGMYSGYNIDSDIIMQLDYIDFDLFAKYNLTKTSVKPYLDAGIGLGYLISSKMKTIVTISGESDSQSVKFDYCNTIDSNVSFGFGLDFYEAIMFDFKYYLGIINILDQEYNNELNLRNGVLSFSLIAHF
jgi:hypothetical protein